MQAELALQLQKQSLLRSATKHCSVGSSGACDMLRVLLRLRAALHRLLLQCVRDGGQWLRTD